MLGELGQWEASEVEESAKPFPGSQPRAPTFFFSASGSSEVRIYVLLWPKELSLEKFHKTFEASGLIT